MALLRRLALALLLLALHSVEPATCRIPTGKQALNAAIRSMVRAGRYRAFLILLKSSGFQPYLERYIQTTPVTILAFTDQAYKALPTTYKVQLRRPAVATGLLKYHMIQQLYPYAALQYFQPAPYSTVYGKYIYRQKPPRGQKTVSFGNRRAVVPAQQAQIIQADVSGRNLRLVIVEGVNGVVLPPGLFR